MAAMTQNPMILAILKLHYALVCTMKFEIQQIGQEMFFEAFQDGCNKSDFRELTIDLGILNLHFALMPPYTF